MADEEPQVDEVAEEPVEEEETEMSVLDALKEVGRYILSVVVLLS